MNYGLLWIESAEIRNQILSDFILALQSMQIRQGQFSRSCHAHFPAITLEWSKTFHYYLEQERRLGEVAENYGDIFFLDWLSAVITSNILVWINISNDSFFWLRGNSICRCQVITAMTCNENISQDSYFHFPFLPLSTLSLSLAAVITSCLLRAVHSYQSLTLDSG